MSSTTALHCNDIDTVYADVSFQEATSTPDAGFVMRSGTLQQLGSKAYALSRLQDLRVPDWFVVPPEALQQSLTPRQRAALESGNPQEIRAALEDLTPHPTVVAEVVAALRALSPMGGRFAVRSSALEEDCADHSFAGQLDSYLFVQADCVPEKLAAVWRSSFSERIQEYRRRNGLPASKTGPAILIQQMIDADCAGVAFSADPVTGRRAVTVVSAVFGLGTALVAGETDADVYEVDPLGKMLRVQIATKKTAHHRAQSASEELSAQGLPPEQQNIRVLNDQQACAVAAMARQVEHRFGQPQDIEWAMENGRLFLLQARPITTLRDMPDPDGMVNIWDNSNVVETYAGITTPLTFSFARALGERIYRELCRMLKVPEAQIANSETTFRRMLGFIRGRVYYNVLNWNRVLALVGIPQPSPEGLPRQRGFAGFRKQAAGAWRLARLLATLAWNYFRLARQSKRGNRRRLPEPAVPLGSMRVDELARYYSDLESRFLTPHDPSLLNDFFATTLHDVLRNLNQRWLGNESGVAADFTRGDGARTSVEPMARLFDLASMVASNPGLSTTLRQAPISEALEALARVPELQQKYNEYLAQFGERCFEELKLESPTLNDDPSMLLRAMGELAERELMATGAGAQTPAGESAEERLRVALRGRPIRRYILRWVLTNTRDRLRDRENLRLGLARIVGRVRRIFLEIGRRLHALDLLLDPRDIFYLQVEEVLAFIEGAAVTTHLKELIALRKHEFEQFREQPAPADRFETRGLVYHAQTFQPQRPVAEVNDVGTERSGMGCCPGMARGQVRVIKDPRGVSLQAGTILVAERTDPGWIMLFPAAAGLIVERGSLLSHAAIVAREMGIPAVVSIPGVTEWLQDGDWVELDGGKGSVRRLCEMQAGDCSGR